MPLRSEALPAVPDLMHNRARVISPRRAIILRLSSGSFLVSETTSIAGAAPARRAGAPVVLSQSWDRLRPGDVAAVVVGSGLSGSSLQIEFG